MAGQNLGALTTTAPLSSSCVDELDVVYKVNTTPDGYYYLLNGPLEPASCYPSAYAGVTTQYYSPAVACPSGFTAACGSTNAIGTVSETRYTCCPTQFSYQCQTTASYAWESTLGCVYPVDSSSSTVWTVVQISSGTTTTTTSAGYAGGMNAYSIQVRFQASDLTTTTSTSTSASTSQTSATTATATGTNKNSSSSTSEASNSSSGLSTGAIAGIAVGAGLVGLAIIGTVAFLMIKKRKQQRELQQQSQGPPTQELDNNNKTTPAYNYYYSELDNGRPHDVHEAPA